MLDGCTQHQSTVLHNPFFNTGMGLRALPTFLKENKMKDKDMNQGRSKRQQQDSEMLAMVGLSGMIVMVVVAILFGL